MEEQPVYYQPPENHDHHIRKMGIALGIFFTALFTTLIIFIIFAPKLAIYLPFSAEKRFVKPYEVMADKWMSDALGSSEVEDYLRELTEGLAAEMHLPEEISLSVHFVDNDMENAFATLGGHIFIFSGLVLSVESENALAMVIAHEIAHVKNRHPVVAMGRGAAIQLMYSYVTGDTMANVGGDLGMMFFSREQEEQADLDALYAINAYYGHIVGFDSFFRAMQSKGHSENDIPVWLSTHPELGTRIEKLQEKIDAEGFDTGELISLPKDILELAKSKPEENSLEDLLKQE